jgi:serine/threonine-protein kinase
VPEPVRGLVERGMTKDPALRPASAAMFVAELESVATAAYGPGWEQRGRRALAGLAAVLATTFPLNQTEAGGAGAPSARRRSVRRRGLRLAAGAAVLILAGGGVSAYALTSGGSFSRASASLTSPVGAPAESLPGGSAPSEAPSPSESPSESPSSEPPSPSPSEPSSPSEAPPESPSESPQESPSESPQDPAPATAKPSTGASHGAAAVAKVLKVQVSGLSLAAAATPAAPAVGRGTVTVTTSGPGKVTLTVRFTVNGAVRATDTITLKGATRYTKVVAHDLGARPCSGTWGITASTEPAAGGTPAGATAAVPRCPTAVTGLKVAALTVADARVATAKVQVTTDGTGPVELTGQFSAPNGTTSGQQIELSGEKSYSRPVSFTFPVRLCGEAVTFTAATNPAAPKGNATQTVTVDCPAAVTKVAVKSLTRTGTTATGTVTVATENTKAVKLTLTWLLGGKATASKQVSLSGRTGYTVTVKYVYAQLPCGTTWSLTAATTPKAANGTATMTKKTDSCGSTGT